MSARGGTSASSRPIWRVWLRGRPETLYPVACGTLAAFAFVFNWATGHRGIFLCDQSGIFDGGWRILQGQVPYKDFFFPFGPVAVYIQALFFRFFGVNWTAAVLPACLFNSVATLSTIRIVRRLGGGSRLLALCGGLATAICFQPPFGTLIFDQTAVFFDFLALQAVVESLGASGYRRGLWRLAGGFSLALAALSKQNFGILFIPVVFAVVAAGELPNVRRACRAVLLAGTGMAAALAIFLGWVWVYSDLPSFIERFLMLGGEIGRSRVTANAIVNALFFQTFPLYIQVDLIGVFAGGIALYLAGRNLFGKKPDIAAWRQAAPAGTVALLPPFYRSISQAVTLNNWQNNCAFVGLAACLGVSLLIRNMSYISITPAAGPSGHPDGVVRLRFAPKLRVCLEVAAVWGVLILGFEGRDAWNRTVQEFGPSTTFRDTVHVRGLERVRWGEPTPLSYVTGTGILRKANFEELASYLAAKKTNFFVIGDSAMLYGILGVRSPQPLLYFMPSHCFLEKEIPRLDGLISASLERNRIGVVVREKVTYLPEVHDAYPRFPRTWAWFTSNFDHVSDFGNYEIWERQPYRAPETRSTRSSDRP